MRIIVDNTYCRILHGGQDNLIKYDFHREMRNLMKVHVDGYERTNKYQTRTTTCLNCGDKEELTIHRYKCIHCGSEDLKHKRHWDGKISYLDKNFRFLTGFLPLILKHLKSVGYNIILEDLRNNAIPPPEQIIHDVKHWELREFMKEDMKKILHHDIGIYFPRCIYKAATNAGKNTFIASVALTLQVNTLVIVHRDYLFKQAYEFFSGAGIEVSRYGRGKKELGKFTLAMVGTLANRCNDVNVIQYLKSVSCLIVDECHRASAIQYKKIIKNTDAYARFFVSGTPLDQDSETGRMDIVGQSSEILREVTNKFLIEKKYSQRPEVLMLDYGSTYSESSTYSQELEQSQYSLNKISAIREMIIQNPSKQFLIVVENIEPGQFIYDNLKDLECIVEFAHGTDADKINKLDRAKDGFSNVLISSLIVETGVNVPTFNVGINMFGSKSTTRVKQVIGRLLRHDGVSDGCTWVDWMEKGRLLSKHTNKRIQIYEEEGFEINYK